MVYWYNSLKVLQGLGLWLLSQGEMLTNSRLTHKAESYSPDHPALLALSVLLVLLVLLVALSREPRGSASADSTLGICP